MAFDAGAVVAKVKADITEFQSSMNHVKQSLDGVKDRAAHVGNEIQDFTKKAALIGAAVATGFGLAAKAALDSAADFEQFEIGYTTLLKDRGKALEALKAIEQDAKKTPFNLPDLVRANQLLISTGLSAEDSRKAIMNLGNAVAATGGGTAELNRLAINMQQIKNIGEATALDIKQFGFAGINIYKLLSDTTGKNIDQLKESKITYEQITTALEKASGAGGMFENALENQSKSLKGVITNIQDVISLTLKDIAVQTGFFDLVKQGAVALMNFLNGFAPVAIAFIKDLQNRVQAIIPFLMQFRDEFEAIGAWIIANKDAILSFLKGMAVAVGALLVIGTVIGLLNLLLNPVSLIILAVGALFAAWQTNFLGIQDITMTVVNALMSFWTQTLFPALEAVAAYFTERWVYIRDMIGGTWKMIIGIIQLAWALISGFIRIGLEILAGDWKGAWEAIKQTVFAAWEGIKNIFNGALQFIKGWGGNLLNELIRPFEEAWKRISDLVNKIKDKLDFTKRQSPSVVDIVTKGVSEVNKALNGLEWTANVTPNAAALAVSGGGQSTSVSNIHVDLSGAVIANEAAAQQIGELMGDSIIKKLQAQLRI